MRLVYRIWLEDNGKVFGEGPYQLLAGVDRTGSLSRAAAEMSMSYNKAWRLIRTLEGRLGFTLLECRAGGGSGGGSAVTPSARELMQRYKMMREEMESFLTVIYSKYFDDGI